MFAVVKIGSAQYKVVVGDEIDVPLMEGAVGESVTFPDVLLVSENEKTKIGTPRVVGAKVKATVVLHFKGEKVDVRRFKSKVRERRHVGFRPQLTKLRITDIHA